MSLPATAAVLGLGSIGMRHLNNLRALGIERLVAYDPDPSRREAAAAAGANFHTDLEDALAQGPQAALVTGPSNVHVPLALAAARAGCALFIEKPLSHSMEGLDELQAELTSRGLAAMVGCNMRFHPGPATVKRLLDEGAAGRPLHARVATASYLPSWRPASDYRRSYSADPVQGGAVLDCIHELDLALWYLGPARLRASAVLPGTSIGIEADGLAELLLAHSCGALSSVHLSFIERDYHRACRVACEEGTISWDFGQPRVLLHGPDGRLARELPLDPAWSVNDMYLDEMRHFLGCLETGEAPANPLAEARDCLAIALEARAGGPS
ncbi:scyllo-inositol 2-dehydrogenase (NAD(+)) [Fundidesulfovibrio magnetotacticus]|uniref:Scyllo-inositol 2-dehydrogenase (NAD(+)) n=1 Tax=Fundidesulfovibrio magnetotacticus TaxID=2730080 RepID=A0A6V8LW83_9BACT|nr:Gfo/Idh/MocA family oxidoreductase [Fundidesulfovibrio magnetotacticus]GFK94861.1 scyllo-inositol 2-dehydrogenase (NAD(+)) [Fundidesulfovibrio magnetotacticus]